MPYTNFPDGVTSFGVPLPNGGLPLFNGNIYFVDAVNGSDGNTGQANNPFASIGQAYTKMVDGHNDVCVIVGDGSTAATQRLSATLTWAKDACHLIGMTAPVPIASRARISTASGATTNLSPLVTVTAQGCIFANFSVFQGVGQAATDEQCWLEQGQRNYYLNVHIGGIGSANGAARAGSYNLKLYGASELYFRNCTIGLDTTTRSAANSNVLLRKNASAVASTRNIFENCYFPMMTSAATPIFIDANESGGIDRFALFKNCFFDNAVNSTSTAITAAVAFHASQGGTVVMDNCTLVGANDYTASDTATVKVAGPVPNGDTSGMAVSADTT